MERDEVWHLYLLRTADGRLYTGIATDVARRLDEHRAGAPRGAKALRGRGPLELVFQAAVGDRGLAQRVEHRVKALSKADKERLVAEGPSAEQLVARLGGGD